MFDLELIFINYLKGILCWSYGNRRSPLYRSLHLKIYSIILNISAVWLNVLHLKISCNLTKLQRTVFYCITGNIISLLCKVENVSNDKDLENGNKWRFAGQRSHKKDKAFYSINRHKTWPFGPSGQKVSALGAEAWFQQSAGRRDVQYVLLTTFLPILDHWTALSGFQSSVPPNPKQYSPFIFARMAHYKETNIEWVVQV